MYDFIYPFIRVNPEYQFDSILSGYNYNFSLIDEILSTGLTTGVYLPLSGGVLTGGVTGTSLVLNSLTVDTNTLFVDSVNDRVGIGTTTPSEKLHVNGNGIVSGLGVGTSTIYSNSININNSGNFRIGNAEMLSKQSNDLSIHSDKLRVANTGNIGIGVSVPTEKLHVNGNIRLALGTGTSISNLGVDSNGVIVSASTNSGTFLPLSGGSMSASTSILNSINTKGLQFGFSGLTEDAFILGDVFNPLAPPTGGTISALSAYNLPKNVLTFGQVDFTNNLQVGVACDINGSGTYEKLELFVKPESSSTRLTSFSLDGNKIEIKGALQSYSSSAVYSSFAVGYNNNASGFYSFIGGGSYNTANAYCSAVVGGQGNAAYGSNSSVIGGTNNIINGGRSFIAGGSYNTVNAYYSAVVGGQGNTASGSHSAVIGGRDNIVSGARSIVLGGQNITGTTDDTVYIENLYLINENWTIELMDAQVVDFYAPYDLTIQSYNTILSATTISLFDDDVAYTTGSTITYGSKITVSAATPTVINLKTTH